MLELKFAYKKNILGKLVCNKINNLINQWAYELLMTFEFKINHHTKVAFKAVPKKKINTLFAVLGRSVLGKTVPEVLSTDRPRTANNIYIFFTLATNFSELKTDPEASVRRMSVRPFLLELSCLLVELL